MSIIIINKRNKLIQNSSKNAKKQRINSKIAKFATIMA